MAENYFRKTVRGYDTEQVDSFIVSLSDRYTKETQEQKEQIARLTAELDRSRRETEEAKQENILSAEEHAKELDEKQKEISLLAAEVGEKMITADRRAEEIVNDAQKKADEILGSAQYNADKCAREATEKANEQARITIEKANEQARSIIENTEKRCADLSQAAETIRRQQADLTASLEQTGRQFDGALSKLKEELK